MKEFYDVLLKNILNYVRTDEMSHEQWLECRQKSIGGSDAGSIMGMSKYGSALTVYFSKKGVGQFTGNAATRRGQIFEPVIREETKKELSVMVSSVPYMFYHNILPFMSANIDGLIYADKEVEIIGGSFAGFAGHEIKTSRNGTDFSKDEVPDSYYCQVQHYMAVTNLTQFVLSVFITDTDELRHYLILRNDSFIDNLYQKETEFWNEFVQKNIPPEPVGLDAEDELVTDMYSGSSTIYLDEMYEHLAAEYIELSEKIKDLTEEKEQRKINLKMRIAEAADGKGDKGTVYVGSYKISWSKYMRKSIDTDRLKKEGLYDQYAKEDITNRFSVTGGK